MARFAHAWLFTAILAIAGCAMDAGDKDAAHTSSAAPAATQAAAPATHPLKSQIFGQGETFALNGAGPLPVDKSYDELSDQQKQLYRSWYVDLGERDAPPFPEGGLNKLYQQILAPYHLAKVRDGLYIITVHVDEHGDAHSLSIGKLGNFEVQDQASGYHDRIGDYLEAVFMRQKYQPGMCDGAPCAMDFAVSINYRRDAQS